MSWSISERLSIRVWHLCIKLWQCKIKWAAVSIISRQIHNWSRVQWNLHKGTHYKVETSIRRTVWRGTDYFALRLNYLRKNLYKADISIKRTLFLYQWCSLYRDSAVSWKSCLNLCVWSWLKDILSLIKNFIPSGLWTANTGLGDGLFLLKILFLKLNNKVELLMLISSLSYLHITSGKKKNFQRQLY